MNKKKITCFFVVLVLATGKVFASYRQSVSDSNLLAVSGVARDVEGIVGDARVALEEYCDMAREIAMVEPVRIVNEKGFVDVQTQTMSELCCPSEDFPVVCALCGRPIDDATLAISSDEFCDVPPKDRMYFHFLCALQCLLLPYKTELSALVGNRDWPHVNLSLVLYWLYARHACIDQRSSWEVAKDVFDGFGCCHSRPLRRRFLELARGFDSYGGGVWRPALSLILPSQFEPEKKFKF